MYGGEWHVNKSSTKLYKVYEEKNIEYIKMFKQKKQNNEKCLIVVDEWTDLASYI